MLGIDVVALHVHHGLHADADSWLTHCKRLCRRWTLRFASTRLGASPPPGDSVEAWARTERYRALAALAREQGASLVLLAHHRRDQAETFVLQALRGAGVAGLASMPPRAERDGVVWARPWLQQPREAIEAYVRRYRLRYIDDASNVNWRHARNRLRHDVWPVLATAFPQAEASLADAARRAAHARELIDEVAAADLLRLDDAAAGFDVVRWRELSSARRRNVLHVWLRAAGSASAALIERLMRELPDASGGRWPGRDGIELRLYRGRLLVDAPRAIPEAGSWRETRLSIAAAGDYVVPGWRGRLAVRHVDDGGVATTLLTELRVAARQGGERFQLAPRSTPRSLKKQFQALAVPAWQRGGPLLFVGQRLMFVPRLGIDARLRAAVGEPQLSLHWIGDPDR